MRVLRIQGAYLDEHAHASHILAGMAQTTPAITSIGLPMMSVAFVLCSRGFFHE